MEQVALDGAAVGEPLALRDNCVVHVREVAADDRRGYTCAKCGDRLIPVLGQHRRHHFRHYAHVECEGALESALHRFAKTVFDEHSRFMVPEAVERWGEESFTFAEARYVDYARVGAEQQLGETRPDIILDQAGGRGRLLVEILVTHRVGPAKVARIRQMGYPCVEVDVGSVITWDGFDREALRHLLIHAPDPNKKAWIHFPGLGEHYAELRDAARRAEEERRAEALQVEAELENRRRQQEAEAAQFADRARGVVQSALQSGAKAARPHRWEDKQLAGILCRQLGVSLDVHPTYLDQPVKGELLFGCHRFLWQANLFRVWVMPIGTPPRTEGLGERSESSRRQGVAEWVLRNYPDMVLPEVLALEAPERAIAIPVDQYLASLEALGFVCR